MRALGIVLFELKRYARLRSSYVYFLLWFAANLAWMAENPDKAPVQWSRRSDVASLLLIPYGLLLFLATPLVAVLFGRAVLQDYEDRMEAVLFTTGVRRSSYLLARFSSALLFALLLFSAMAVGGWAAELLPEGYRSRYAPQSWDRYVWPYLLLALPYLLSVGGLCFCVGTLLRSIVPVHVSWLILLLLAGAASSMSVNLDQRALAELLEPFGLLASFQVPPFILGEQPPLLSEAVLHNRLLWMTLGVGALGLTLLRFRFERSPRLARERAADPGEPAPAAGIRNLEAAGQSGPVPLSFDRPRLLARLTWLALRDTVKTRSFLVLLAAALLVTVVQAQNADSLYGTRIYPVTRWIVAQCSQSFHDFFVLSIALFAGELVFRERDARMAALLDVLPVPQGLYFASRLLSLFLVQVLLLSALLLSGLFLQALSGYHHFELGLYLQELFALRLIDYCLLCVPAMAVYALVENKYLGHALIVLGYSSGWLPEKLGLEQHLYRYGSSPGYEYSDMNGYGHFLGPVRWFQLYWALCAVLLAVLTHLCWQRGAEAGWRARLRAARERWTRPLAGFTALTATAFLTTGAFIYYNTNVLHQYRSPAERVAARAEYEQRYAAPARRAQPRIHDVQLELELYPAELRLRARGRYVLSNASTEDISTVYVSLTEPGYERLSLGKQATPSQRDERHGMYTFELEEPLRPGESTELHFELERRPSGFSNERAQTAIVENGTMFHSAALPAIGYQRERELLDPAERTRQGLPSARRALSDLAANADNYITPNADWVSFEATISTSADQIALVPGYLQREWREGERRFFHYRMDRPILHFFSLLSGRYQVLRDSWQGVSLEIYYHPGHEHNLARMMQGMKDALAYCSAAYGPYPHRQLRIVEFPRYESFAQSFPNTIPYSEALGFVAWVKPEDPANIDYPYYVTAHEVAHQWWGGQVVGGAVPGARFLSESMAQYSALMVMAKAYGPDRVQRFLRYELDGYAKASKDETNPPRPLAVVEAQPFVYYQKGGLALFSLQEAIGEAQVNRAARAFLEEYRFRGPPYPSSRELLAQLRRETPPELQEFFDDWFERVVELNLSVSAASYRPLADGRYELTVQYGASKSQRGANGKLAYLPFSGLVEFGAFDAKGAPLKLEKRQVQRDEGQVQLLLDQRPAEAVIDPRGLLLDVYPANNRMQAELATQEPTSQRWAPALGARFRPGPDAAQRGSAPH